MTKVTPSTTEERPCALIGFGLAGLVYYSQLCLWPVQDFKDVKDFCCHCQVHEWHQGSALSEASNPYVGASRDWRCQCALDLAGSCVHSVSGTVRTAVRTEPWHCPAYKLLLELLWLSEVSVACPWEGFGVQFIGLGKLVILACCAAMQNSVKIQLVNANSSWSERGCICFSN